MKTLVFLAAEKLHVNPCRIFGLTFEYFESFRPRKWVLKTYKKWLYQRVNNKEVEDYCLDVLANRANLK